MSFVRASFSGSNLLIALEWVCVPLDSGTVDMGAVVGITQCAALTKGETPSLYCWGDVALALGAFNTCVSIDHLGFFGLFLGVQLRLSALTSLVG